MSELVPLNLMGIISHYNKNRLSDLLCFSGKEYKFQFERKKRNKE